MKSLNVVFFMVIGAFFTAPSVFAVDKVAYWPLDSEYRIVFYGNEGENGVAERIYEMISKVEDRLPPSPCCGSMLRGGDRRRVGFFLGINPYVTAPGGELPLYEKVEQSVSKSRQRRSTYYNYGAYHRDIGLLTARRFEADVVPSENKAGVEYELSFEGVKFYPDCDAHQVRFEGGVAVKLYSLMAWFDSHTPAKVKQIKLKDEHEIKGGGLKCTNDHGKISCTYDVAEIENRFNNWSLEKEQERDLLKDKEKLGSEKKAAIAETQETTPGQ